jgi:uncharacterized protein (TIGR03083 family)
VLSAEYLETIRSDGETILAHARNDRIRPVPQYSGWVMTDLVNHLAAIHGRTTLICRELPTERIAAPALPHGRDVLDWYRDNLEEMLDTLSASDPDTTVWGFWPEPSLGLWERRMVIETGVHRWDADQAFGQEGPLPDVVSISGLNELPDMWLRRLGVVPTIEVVATDLGMSWVYGPGAPTATVAGAASDIYLRMMSRPSPVELPPEWAAAVDSLEPPRR